MIPIVMAFYDAINRRSFGELADIVSASWIDRQPAGDQNLDQFIAVVRDVVAPIPDFTIIVEDAFGGNDRVAARLRLTGTHQGDFLGVSASGRTISIRSHDIHRVADGKLVESWQVEDWFAALEQIGGAGK